jgi:hypothetical protein
MNMDNAAIFKHNITFAAPLSFEFFWAINADGFILLLKLDVINLVAFEYPSIGASAC